MGSWANILERLLARPTSYRSQRRSQAGLSPTSFTGFRPNAPRFVTVLAAIALSIVGLSVTVHPIVWVNERLADANLTLTHHDGWLCLLASPVLLVAGSLLPGL
jgi:hypothetical protein